MGRPRHLRACSAELCGLGPACSRFATVRGGFTSQVLRVYSRLMRLQVPKQNCTEAVLNTALITVTSQGRSAALSLSAACRLSCSHQQHSPPVRVPLGLFSFSYSPALENKTAIAAAMPSSGCGLQSAGEVFAGSAHQLHGGSQETPLKMVGRSKNSQGSKLLQTGTERQLPLACFVPTLWCQQGATPASHNH